MALMLQPLLYVACVNFYIKDKIYRWEDRYKIAVQKERKENIIKNKKERAQQWIKAT